MKPALLLRNQQQTRRVDLRLVRQIVLDLMHKRLEKTSFNLAFWFVNLDRITRLNEQFLQHAGATDVITFDYTDPVRAEVPHGEIFICVDVALAQARRFRTDWRAELIRYVIHGVLHLCGYDDQEPSRRRRMKQAEDRFLRDLSNRFNLLEVGS